MAEDPGCLQSKAGASTVWANPASHYPAPTVFSSCNAGHSALAPSPVPPPNTSLCLLRLPLVSLPTSVLHFSWPIGWDRPPVFWHRPSPAHTRVHTHTVVRGPYASRVVSPGHSADPYTGPHQGRPGMRPGWDLPAQSPAEMNPLGNPHEHPLSASGLPRERKTLRTIQSPRNVNIPERGLHGPRNLQAACPCGSK